MPKHPTTRLSEARRSADDRADLAENQANFRASSELFAFVHDCQHELGSLVAHQHVAKFVPVDLSAIDDQRRQSAVMRKVELMELSQAIGEPHWFKLDVFESFKSGYFRHLGIEASDAELAVSAFDGAVVADVKV